MIVGILKKNYIFVTHSEGESLNAWNEFLLIK